MLPGAESFRIAPWHPIPPALSALQALLDPWKEGDGEEKSTRLSLLAMAAAPPTVLWFCFIIPSHCLVSTIDWLWEQQPAQSTLSVCIYVVPQPEPAPTR